MKYRRRFDIVADIIGVAEQGARRTKIMYFANLSHLLLKRYLEDAVGVGFLQAVGKEFYVTPKGHEYLDKYARFRDKYARVSANLEALQGEAEELERLCRPRRNWKDCRRSKLAMLG